ncbi:MAG TPA: sensor histidine kinase [Longimicrobium sp.]|jgi:sensor histidine kinase YesM
MLDGRRSEPQIRRMEIQPMTYPADDDAAERGSAARWLAGLFAAWVAIVALGTVQAVLGMQGMGAEVRWQWILPPRVLDLALGALYLPLLLRLVRRPPGRGGWAAHALVLVAATAVFALAKTLGGAYLERLLIPGVSFRGSRVAKGIGEFLSFALLAGGVYALELRRRLVHGERRALRLQARLSEARLEALASQLRPHFLFNTLNAISVLMHRDPRAADLMLTRLADLLRATLRTPGTREVQLRTEMDLLRRYLDIMRVRFGPRLGVEESVPPELENALVPPFLLQPLVENALEHGIERRSGTGRVRIAAEAVDGRLRLTVWDDGPGVGAARHEGVGLSNTRRRLEQLYGSDGRLELASEAEAGTVASVELPLRRSPRAEPVPA